MTIRSRSPPSRRSRPVTWRAFDRLLGEHPELVVAAHQPGRGVWHSDPVARGHRLARSLPERRRVRRGAGRRRRRRRRPLRRSPHRDAVALGREQRRRRGARCAARCRSRHRGRRRRDRRRHAAHRRNRVRPVERRPPAARARRPRHDVGGSDDGPGGPRRGLPVRRSAAVCRGSHPQRSGVRVTAVSKVTAELLRDRGADIDWIGWDELTPLDAAARSEAPAVVEWLRGIGARSAADARPS